MALDKNALRQRWDLLPNKNDWYSIYQWEHTGVPLYADWIAEWIVTSFDDIRLMNEGLRTERFKIEDHRGQANLQTHIEQFTEKRFVRAIFNLEYLPPLGQIIDYEVPLKASQGAKHGDIDLLCLTSEAVLCVEAKDPRRNESILKAILQAFVYTSLIADRYDRFVKEFKLPLNQLLTPAILIGKKAENQLKELTGNTQLRVLVHMLDERLERLGAVKFRYFLVRNTDSELEDCLRIEIRDNRDHKVVFKSGFTPYIEEWKITR